MNSSAVPPPSSPTTATPPKRSNPRLMIALVALVCAMPFLSAWVAYYIIKPDGAEGNYGSLLEVKPLSRLALPPVAMEAMQGKWLLVNYLPEGCDAGCEQALYATRQAYTMLGKERDRVKRMVISRDAISPELLEQHPNLLNWQVPPELLPEDWRGALQNGILVVDPLGNEVMSWPRDPDIKKLNRDLMRLLRASRIG